MDLYLVLFLAVKNNCIEIIGSNLKENQTWVSTERNLIGAFLIITGKY